MNNEIPTPRTDIAAFAIAGMSGDTGFDSPPKDFCKADFARTLERELAEAKAENEALNEPIDGVTLAELGAVIAKLKEGNAALRALMHCVQNKYILR